MSHDRETSSLLMIEIRYFICTFRSIMIEFLQWGTFFKNVMFSGVCILISHSIFFTTTGYSSFFF